MTEQITELKQRLVVGRKQDGRSCYDPQAKRELIEAGLQPGVSVAKLALMHGTMPISCANGSANIWVNRLLVV